MDREWGIRRAGGVIQGAIEAWRHRSPGRADRPRVALVVGSVLALAAIVPASTDAVASPTLTLTPGSIAASTPGTSVALRYSTATRSTTSVTLQVPAAWTAGAFPQTSRSREAGYASLARSGCDSKTKIVSITRTKARVATMTIASSCAAHGMWTLTIKGLAAPRAVGTTSWLARIRTASGSWRQTTLRIKVGPGTLDLLATRNALPTSGDSVAVDALVRDAAGRPLRGVVVRFRAPDGATTSPTVATTDARGIAVTAVVARSTPAGSTVTLVATAAPLTASMTLAVAGEGTLTVATAPGGTAAPPGMTSHPLGASVDVAITPDDPTTTPGVMVDGVTVSPTPPAAGSTAWHVSVTITGANRVDVSYARLAETTKAADASTGRAFAEVATGGTSIRFAALTPFLEGLALGDILATSPAAAAAGMPPVLLRITAVSHEGSGVVFATVPAELTDAVQTATLDAHLPLVEQIPVAARSTSASMREPSMTLSGSVAVGGWGDDVSSQLGPITVNGSYSVSGPTLNIATTIGMSAVESFRATLSETVAASVALDGASKSAAVERTLAHHAFNADIVLGPIVVPVVTTVDAGAGATSELGLTFHTKVGIIGTLEAGVAYTATAGWSLVGNQDVTFPFDPPTAPALTGRVRGYPFFQVTPAIGFSYGVGSLDLSLFCGPYAKAQLGFLELAGDTSATPAAWLDGGLSVSGGARCSFGDPKELTAVELVRKRLWDSGGLIVPVAPTPTAPASSASPITTVATPFLGPWINVLEPAPRSCTVGQPCVGITHIDMAAVPNGLSVHPWGNCSPTDCDWGVQVVPLSAIGQDTFSMQWNPAFATQTQTYTLGSDGVLTVSTSDHFNDGRCPITYVDKFRRG